MCVSHTNVLGVLSNKLYLRMGFSTRVIMIFQINLFKAYAVVIRITY
jgi:hypothetical protein